MVGDVYELFSSVAPAAYLEVKPASGKEVVIHNVYHPDAINLKLVKGTDELDFLDEAGKSVLTGMYLHLTNTQFLRIYNTALGAIFIAVDGIKTKD